MSKLDVVCVGEAIIDLIPVDEVFYKACFGGAPMNTAVACAKLGLKTGVVTAVGKEAFGKIIVETLKEHGIDISRLRQLPYRTTLAVVVKLPKGEREFFFYRKPWSLSADTEVIVEDEDLKYVEQSKLVHFSGFAFSQEPARESYLKLLEHAREAGVEVSVDPTLRLDVWKTPEEAREILRKVAEQADILLATLKEYEFIWRVKGLEEVLRKVKALGYKMAGVKMGRQGAVLVSDGEILQAPIFDVEVKDTVGAGDAWNAAAIYGHLKGLPPEETLVLANAVASIKCMHVGAIAGLPSIREATEFIEKQGKPVVQKYRFSSVSS